MSRLVAVAMALAIATSMASCSPVHLKYDNNIGKLYKDVNQEQAMPERKIVGHSYKKDIESAVKLFTLLRKNAGLSEDLVEVTDAANALVREFVSSKAPEGKINATYKLLEAELNKNGKSLEDIDIGKTIVVGLIIGIGR